MSVPIILMIGGATAVLLLVVGIVVSISSERTLVEERIGRYLEDTSDDDLDGDRTTPISDWVNVRVERSTWGERISQRLAQADLKMKPGEYLALMVIMAIAVGAVAWVLGGQSPISAAIGGIVGLMLPRFYVGRQKNARMERFSEQLPDMLNLMVNGLRAGYSTMQAMEAVSKELPPPISDEFQRVVKEMQLGLPMELALDNLYRRIPSDDLDLIIAAINVQREVGGNLAEILDTISYTIRERVRIKGEIRVLTSQVMYSGRFLALLPIILLAVLWFMNRDYILFVFEPNNRICGIAIMVTAAILVGLGYVAMNKLAQIEV